MIVLADSSAQLCCLARSGLYGEKVGLGCITDEMSPISELFRRNQKKIEQFFKQAPGFCSTCIDLDFNHFLNNVWNILDQYEAATFQRMRIFFHDGENVLVSQGVGQTDIALVGVPSQYQNSFNRGQVIRIDCDIQSHPAPESLEHASKN
jgi:hypothetical protein